MPASLRRALVRRAPASESPTWCATRSSKSIASPRGEGKSANYFIALAIKTLQHLGPASRTCVKGLRSSVPPGPDRTFRPLWHAWRVVLALPLARTAMERRLAAIMAADVVGYSRLMSRDELGTLATLQTHRSELITPTLSKHRGRIV